MDEKKIATEKPQEKKPKSKIEPDKPPKELGGRSGLDPVRYGDWENKGIASDF